MKDKSGGGTVVTSTACGQSWKVSRYLILSQRSYRGRTGERLRLVYGTRSGTVLAVSEKDASAMEAGEVPAASSPRIQQFRDSMILVPDTEDELATMLRRNEDASESLAARSFTLLPTSYCNMGCGYCGQAHVRGGLSAGHRHAVARRVTKAIEDPGTRSVHVHWFGGEPLMGLAVLLDLSRTFTAAADSAACGYTADIVTNGSLLTRRTMRRLVETARVRKVEITLDGPQAVHDRHRPLKSGQGSFERIVTTVQECLDDPALHSSCFRIRTNIDAHNEDFVKPFLVEMKLRGFDNPRVDFDLHSVHSWSNDVSKIQLARDRYARREASWLELMHRLGLQFTMLPDRPRHVTCVAVTRAAEVISSSGAIFSCTEQPLVSRSESAEVLARVQEHPSDTPRPAGPYDSFFDDVRVGHVPCHRCPLFGVCGGACPKLWQDGHVPCPSYKFNMQQRLDLVAERNHLLPC